jgi:hypothetical protein
METRNVPISESEPRTPRLFHAESTLGSHSRHGLMPLAANVLAVSG